MIAADPARPNPRGSFKCQDAAETTAEMTARTRSPRSTKQLLIRLVYSDTVRPIVAERHYLRCMPAIAPRCYGVYSDGQLAGAVVFTAGSINAHRLLAAGRPGDVLTLARFWLSDDLPPNSESRALAIVLRDLRRVM